MRFLLPTSDEQLSCPLAVADVEVELRAAAAAAAAAVEADLCVFIWALRLLTLSNTLPFKKSIDETINLKYAENGTDL